MFGDEFVVKKGFDCSPICYSRFLPKLIGTRHTEVVYAHQATIFRAIAARGIHSFQLFPPFCSKRSKQAAGVCMTKIGHMQNCG